MSVTTDGIKGYEYQYKVTVLISLLRDIDKNTVNFALNFDDTTEEPTVLPARFPNILINGISDSALGKL